MGEIGPAKARSLRQLGVDEDVSAIEPIGHDVLSAHGAIFGPLVAVVALLTFGFFLLVGGRHARDRDFKRQNRFNRTGKRDLHRAAHLTGINTGAHDRPKGAHIEEVVAHEFGQRPGLIVVLRIQLAVFPNLICIAADRFISLAMLLVEYGAFLYIDAIARLVAFRELGVISYLALQRNIADQPLVGLGVHSRHVAGVGIAVRIAVGDVEQENDVEAVGERGHQAASSGADFSDFLKNSLRWW